MRPSNDREAISLIIDGLSGRGIVPTHAVDGAGEAIEFVDKNEALDWLTSCDDSRLEVYVPEIETDSWIYFVLGNDPEEVVCDYGVSLSPYLDPIVEPWWS